MFLTPEQHAAKVRELQHKTAKAKELVARGNEMTQEDLMAAKALREECVALQAEIKAHAEAVAQREEIRATTGELDRFLSAPSRGLPLPDGADPFIQPAGATYVERTADRDTLFQDGAGVFGEETWRAVNAPEYKRAFSRYLREGRGGLRAAELKTLESGIDPQGGYLAPADQLAQLVSRKPTPTRVAGLVSNYQTAREFVELMKVNYSASNIYTTGFRVTKTGENPASVTAARVTDSDLFGSITIPVHTFMLTGVLTNNQLEDAALNVLQWATDKFRETIDLLWDDKILNGTGRQEPQGILMAPGTPNQPDVVVSGNASALTADGLLDLNLGMPEQYDENGRYVMNKTNAWKTVRKFKDSASRYLIGLGDQENGLSGPARRTIDGYPVIFSGFMPDQGPNAYPVIFGDFRGYQLVQRVGFSIQVLRELYAEMNQVAIVGRVRFGGMVLEPWRLKIQKCST
jgi:HK97 family phage major capsid protein